MEKMTDLRDLLKHEIKDLYSAEEQIIEAMPRMIEKTNNPQLRQALQRHLQITEGQLKRLEQVQELMDHDKHEIQEQKNSGLFARLMRRRSQNEETGSGDEKCLGMEGLLREGEKVMGEEMEPTVMDAAIIACAQKIEHYEICGYGTARAYARELNLGEIAELLEQTLDEEYEADDRLTDLAIGKVNEDAEMGGSRRRSVSASSTDRSGSRSVASKSTSRSRAGEALAASSSRGASTSGRSSSSRSAGSSGRSASASTRSASSSGRSTSSSGRSTASSGRSTSGRSASSRSNESAGRGSSSSARSTGRTKTAAKSSSRGGAAAPAGKASASRSTTKSSSRSAGTGSTRSAAASRSAKAPSKAAAAKGGRNSSGGGRTASKTSGRGSTNGRSSGRR